jgi:hypothetical protein
MLEEFLQMRQVYGIAEARCDSSAACDGVRGASVDVRTGT